MFKREPLTRIEGISLTRGTRGDVVNMKIDFPGYREELSAVKILRLAHIT